MKIKKGKYFVRAVLFEEEDFRNMGFLVFLDACIGKYLVTNSFKQMILII